MKKLIIALLLSAIAISSAYAEEEVKLDSVKINLDDKASLQRGAKDFAQYCFSCHSAHFMRYNRIAKDTGMTEAEVRKDFIFTRNKKGVPTKIGALMKVSMTEDYAKKAFNTAVPDLTVEARARGADWLYTYLRSFYIDPSRPTGMNNTVFPSVGMPNVVWELQGLQKAVYKTVERDGIKFKVIDHLELVSPGSMNKKEYDAFATDLVNFMVYMGEPAQLQRKALGWKVLLFLAGFFVVAYMLKKEYWKDVH